MAIHYLADLNAPHHAANLTAPYSFHMQYESWVDDNMYDFIQLNATQSTYDYLCGTATFKEFSDAFSAHARSNIGSCDYGTQDFFGIWHFDPIYAQAPTYDCVTMAERATAGLYYRFLRDVGML